MALRCSMACPPSTSRPCTTSRAACASGRPASAAAPRLRHASCDPCGPSSSSSSSSTAAWASSTTSSSGHRPGRRQVTAASTAVDGVERSLSLEEAAKWEAAAAVLAERIPGLARSDCDRLLARAFGWTTQAFWRQEKVEEVPTAEQVGDALDFLEGPLLCLAGDELAKVVRAFPEALACSVDQRLEANIQTLERQWRLSGAVLTKAIVRQPQVLGYSVDCAGDCIGQCNRCWVRF